MKDKEIIVKYLIGTFSLTFLMWGIILLFNQYEYLKTGTIGFWVIYCIGGLASTFFGAYLSIKSGKTGNLFILVKEMFNIKLELKYYGLVFIFFVISFFLFNEPEIKMPLYFVLPIIIKMIFFGGLEEIGWRYTFQPALERQIPFTLASIITGCLWAIWHLPLFFMDGINKGMDFSLFFVNVISMSFMLAAIYKVSNSLWLCVLFHAIINAFSQVFILEDKLSNYFFAATVIKIICAVVIVHLHNRIIKDNKIL